jgi:hypothetical protein
MTQALFAHMSNKNNKKKKESHFTIRFLKSIYNQQNPSYKRPVDFSHQ